MRVGARAPDPRLPRAAGEGRAGGGLQATPRAHAARAHDVVSTRLDRLGTEWRGAARRGAARRGAARHGTTQHHDTTRHDTTRHYCIRHVCYEKM